MIDEAQVAASTGTRARGVRLAAISQKGGVGKTSLVQNLAAALAKGGARCLMVDFDAQSNLTSGWGLDLLAERPTVYEALRHPEETERIVVPLRDNLALLPASLDLSGADSTFHGDMLGIHRLRYALDTVADHYDFTLIDAPPSLGFYTNSALLSATHAIIPLQVHAYAYKALDQLLPILEKARLLNPRLEVLGFVLTMYDRRNALTFTIEEAARARFGKQVFRTVIPHNVRVAESPLLGLGVAEYDARSSGAAAYQALAEEVLERVQE